jgi:hypothetical protein
VGKIVIINNTKVLFTQAWVTLVNFAILCMPFGFIAPKTLNHLAFQCFDFERTWWRLFQKRVVRTECEICDFILLEWKMI